MRNRYFSLFVLIGILCFCGLLFFLVSRPQNQVPIKIYKAIPFSNDKLAKGWESNPGTHQSVVPKDSQNADALHQTIGEQNETEEEQLKARFLQIEASSEFQTFVDTKMQQWVNAYNQTGIFNFSFQEFFDFFESQGMPRVDFAQSALEAFREYFPTGEPEDYDAEMATRFLEVFLEFSGTSTQASINTANALYAEPDFSAWILGRFKGQLGPQLQWMEEQTVIAMGSKNASFSSVIEEQVTAPSVTDGKKVSPPISASEPLSSKVSPPISASEPLSSNVANIVPLDAAVPLSMERILSIRKTLHHYGPYNGVLYLLETDAEATQWLFKNFNTLDEINAWIENANKTMSSELPTLVNPKPQSQELFPWNEIPQ